MIKYIGNDNYNFYNNLNIALKIWLPKEYHRKWSAVLSDGKLHANSRCPIVGGEDFWDLGSRDKLVEKTFEEVISFQTHCLECIRSYLPGGFIYEWFNRIYYSLIKIDKQYQNRDINKAFFELLNFKFTENMGVNEQREIYNKLREYDKNKEIYSRYLWYGKGDELIYNQKVDYSRSIILKNGFILLFLDQKRDKSVYVLSKDNISEAIEIFIVLHEDEKKDFSRKNISMLLKSAELV